MEKGFDREEIIKEIIERIVDVSSFDLMRMYAMLPKKGKK